MDDDNTPFNDAGRCDYATLCGLTGIQDSLPAAQPLEADPNNNNAVDLQLASYVQNTDGVDEKLRGMVFKARSEWDPANNEERYKDLNDPYGFFGKQKDTNPDGYTRFTDFLSKFQFLDKTPLAGQQLWFFHPLAFIRHFRRCAWLSAQEMAECFPRSLLQLELTQFRPSKLAWNSALLHAEKWNRSFNRGTRKYGINSIRLLYFLAHVIPETGRLSLVKEIGGEHQSYNPYYGRGLIQLTHLENYKPYGNFRKFNSGVVPEKFHALGWDPDVLIAKDNSGTQNTDNCVDSACFYVVKRSGMLSHVDAGVTQDDAIRASKDVNGYVAIENLNGLEVRLQSVVYLRNILTDEVFKSEQVTITFEWRRNSQKEPVLDAQGAPVMEGHPPHQHPKKKFYKTTHTINASIERQIP
ncbi:hypothetical protein R70241_05782 [Paraburkholderia saeva]|nr:hypothetical protein R70241_05782 [Paraburkholderia saeva]